MNTGNECPVECRPACPSVFDRVVSRHYTTGGTRVMWELLPTFTDPNPLIFQLQVGSSANPDADDWEDVGLAVENVYSATDPDQRVWGKTDYTHYRVKLTSPISTYYSDPVGGLGVLDRRDWLLAREKVRAGLQYFRKGRSGQRGYLLKRRWSGQRCPVCIDLQTNESRNPDCPTCYGTGFQCGYFYPMSCVWASLSPRTSRVERDAGQGRGTINDIVVSADMLMTDLLSEDDVWVADRTDDRYYVHKVTNTSEIRGVPITAQVELRPIAFSSSIYTIPIPQILQELT